MKAGERTSDVESELASDDPTDLDDMVFSDEEESREVVVPRKCVATLRRRPSVRSRRPRGVRRFLRRGSVRQARTLWVNER